MYNSVFGKTMEKLDTIKAWSDKPREVYQACDETKL